MLKSLALFLGGTENVVVIGSDTPHLSPGMIEMAFLFLDRNDVVLGPAEDGGYYLIGLKRAHVGLFRDISWSTDKVFQETVARTRQLNLRMATLPTLADIDTFPDLVRLSRKLQDSLATTCPATRYALKYIMEPKNGILAI